MIGGGRPLLHPFDSRSLAGWINSSGRLGDAAPDLGPASNSVLAAIGAAHDGIEGFARTHREAMQAKRVAELAHSAPGSVTQDWTVALVSLASAGLDQARAFVHTELGPLALEDEAWSDWRRRSRPTFATVLA